ncbi:hypothetical protein IFM89_022839 [Coptis chinensis]|uniref:Uncharacterized protein n=1 Tax=Coptis chinensis TaxID=261450 RepID=A0A835J034_9MAGN|nr:hypothetical protein IFM89_022839 [Coptis chinensis]
MEEEEDPFNFIIQESIIPISQQELLNHTPFALQHLFPNETRSDSDDIPEHSTGILICSVPENEEEDEITDLYQTPEEQLAHVGSQIDEGGEVFVDGCEKFGGEESQSNVADVAVGSCQGENDFGIKLSVENNVFDLNEDNALESSHVVLLQDSTGTDVMMDLEPGSVGVREDLEQGEKELGMEYIVENVSCCNNNVVNIEGEMLNCNDAMDSSRVVLPDSTGTEVMDSEPGNDDAMHGVKIRTEIVFDLNYPVDNNEDGKMNTNDEMDSSHTGTEVMELEPCNNDGISESFRQKEDLQFVQCGKEFVSTTRTENVFDLNDTVENNEDRNAVKFMDVAMGDNYLGLLDSKDGDEDNELVEAFVTNENTEVSVELDAASHSTTGELERCHVVLPDNGDTEVMESDPGNNDANLENFQSKEDCQFEQGEKDFGTELRIENVKNINNNVENNEDGKSFQSSAVVHPDSTGTEVMETEPQNNDTMPENIQQKEVLQFEQVDKDLGSEMATGYNFTPVEFKEVLDAHFKYKDAMRLCAQTRGSTFEAPQGSLPNSVKELAEGLDCGGRQIGSCGNSLGTGSEETVGEAESPTPVEKRGQRANSPCPDIEALSSELILTIADLTDDDVDNALVIVLKAGCRFPRPRWWKPGGYGKSEK